MDAENSNDVIFGTDKEALNFAKLRNLSDRGIGYE
jgi:hypothetical protein